MICARALLALMIILFTSTSRADLVYLEDFGLVADRTAIFFGFGALDPQGRGKMSIGLMNGASLGSIPVVVTEDPAQFRNSMQKLLRILNDPANLQINIANAIKQAGF